ncbi:MAG: zinc ribbon domain-containing protein [Planctomycetes bacterium]|nr:zinc ribbon domain-containing protein [Planctomycetota bacterium]
MDSKCPRCHHPNRDAARFCATCGLGLETVVDGTAHAGRSRVTSALPVPSGYVPVGGAAHLYYSWESSLGGGRLIGTEGALITIFNAGYELRDLNFRINGYGRDEELIFTLEEWVSSLPGGGRGRIEVPAYRIETPLRVLTVELMAAEFGEASRAAAEDRG